MKKTEFQLVAGALRLLKTGSVEVRTDHAKTLVVNIDDNTINLDFHDASLFKSDEKKRRMGMLDSLQQAKNLGKALADKDVTVSISRKNKPVLKIGKKARPSFSRVATRSGDIQVLNLKELRRLDKELA